MGNCQAAEISAVVIQHPGGRIERLYWPTTAGDVMKANPGHHVAILTLCIAQQKKSSDNDQTDAGTVRFTRVRLLKPKDMLLMGQVYRLVSSQEVSKALKARKLEKMKKQRQPAEDSSVAEEHQKAEERARIEPRRPENQERDRPPTATATAGRVRQWRPKLQSISEGMA